jgi:hypothetical protein
MLAERVHESVGRRRLRFRASCVRQAWPHAFSGLPVAHRPIRLKAKPMPNRWRMAR